MTDIDTTSEDLKLASSTWMRATGIRISDATGWERDDNVQYGGIILQPKDFEEPILRGEFIARARISDVERWPDPLYDERPKPPDEFVSRLAEALKSEFGAQFGMGINAEDESWKRVADGIARKMRCEEEIETYLTGAIVFRFNRRVSE